MFEKIVQHFSTLEQRPLERMAFLVGGLLLFWIIEGSIPLLQMQYKKNKLRHATVNFSFTINAFNYTYSLSYTYNKNK